MHNFTCNGVCSWYCAYRGIGALIQLKSEYSACLELNVHVSVLSVYLMSHRPPQSLFYCLIYKVNSKVQ